MAEEESKTDKTKPDESLADNKKALTNIRFKPNEDDIITIEAVRDKFSAVVIWLHGLGDRGSSWKQALTPIASSYPHIKWIFPTAATAPVTFYGGFRSTAWHDIVSLKNWEENKEFAGRDVSVDFIKQLIEKEINENENITANNILLGGFSQGGATALFTGLTTQYTVAGIVCLSGYCPELNIEKYINENNINIPILMYHCKGDGVVNSKLANIAYNTLKNECNVNNIQLKFNGVEPSGANNNGHTTTPKEMRDVAKFIGKRLPFEGDDSSFCVLL
eukprot:6102_1